MAVTLLSYLWDFGDGVISTERAPGHLYRMPGIYTVTLTVEDTYGNTIRTTTSVYVYDWEYAPGGLHVAVTTRCLRYALKPSQGVGWSRFDGDDWLWPEARVGDLKIFGADDRSIQLVWNARDGRPYVFGELDQWTDAEDDYAGTEIQGEVQFREDRGSAEQFFLETQEHHLHFRPESDDRGYRDAFSVDIGEYVDGAQTPAMRARDIPIDGDLVFDRKREGHRKKLYFITSSSEWKLVRRRSWYTAKDKTANPADRVMSEYTWQEQFAEPLLWLSRSDPLVLNRASGANVTGSFFAAVAGPDNKPGSAMQFNGGQGLSVDVGNLTSDFTLIAWLASSAQATILSFANGANGQMAVTVNPWLAFGGLSAGMTWDFTSWTMLAVKREGGFYRYYQNGALIGTEPTGGTVTFGGIIQIMQNQTGDVFDLRVYDSAIADLGLLSYYQDITENEGNAYLPLF